MLSVTFLIFVLFVFIILVIKQYVNILMMFTILDGLKRIILLILCSRRFIQ